MSVFTTVTVKQLRHRLHDYAIGELLDLQGIAAGITNTNYFVTTEQGRFVLTLFERNTAEELPYFLDLMAHLAERQVPCPRPIPDNSGHRLAQLNGKPAALVTCLRGRDITQPSLAQCAEVGRVLAEMHIAGSTFPLHMQNPRGPAWCRETAAKVADTLSADDRAMLQAELAFQAALDTAGLPHGVIHADLFRDNVLFDGERLGGLIDFYYACNDILLYDVAIAVNDWCAVGDGLDVQRMLTLLKAYDAVRPLNTAERQAWPALLRRAALRFWISRLYDFHYPQAGELTHAKDPQQFQKILKMRIAHPAQLPQAFT
ncbi:MAG TPA: homoserine kinase [Methylophilaceae bacterium]|nr:homoserine kinase [Methylophilaceae bacterium]